MSLTASLLALFAAVKKIGKTVDKFHSGIKDAEREVQQALNQLSTIRRVVEGLEVLRDSPGPHAEEIAPSIPDLVTATKSLLFEIERAFPKNISAVNFRKKIQWAIEHRQVIAKLSAHIQRVEPLLSLTFQCVHV